MGLYEYKLLASQKRSPEIVEAMVDAVKDSYIFKKNLMDMTEEKALAKTESLFQIMTTPYDKMKDWKVLHESSMYLSKLMADGFNSSIEEHVVWFNQLCNFTDIQEVTTCMKEISENPMGACVDFIHADEFYWSVVHAHILQKYARDALYGRAFLLPLDPIPSASTRRFDPTKQEHVQWLAGITVKFDIGSVTYKDLASNPYGRNFHEKDRDNEWFNEYTRFMRVYGDAALNGHAYVIRAS